MPNSKPIKTTARTANPSPGRPVSQSANGKKAASATPPDTVMRTLPTAQHLDRGLEGLGAIIHTLGNELAAATTKGAIHTARAFVAMHYLKERLDAVESAFSKMYSEYQKLKIPEIFTQEGITSVPLDEGYRVGMSSRFFASIQEGKKAEAYEWLKNNGLESLITPTVNSSTLSAALKAMLEEHNKEAPELYFSVAYVPNISVTPTKK